jgi:hypothetical protein
MIHASDTSLSFGFRSELQLSGLVALKEERAPGPLPQYSQKLCPLDANPA